MKIEFRQPFATLFLDHWRARKKRRAAVKAHIFWEGHKIFRNLHRRFVLYSNGQIYDGDFAKFCDLLRIYIIHMNFIYHNDELRLNLTWLDCLRTDSEGLILLAESNQILFKIYSHSLNFHVSSIIHFIRKLSCKQS